MGKKKTLRAALSLGFALCMAFSCLPAKAEAADLTALQQRLLSLGYEIGTADGIAGAKTTAAIKLAQTLLSDAGYEVSVTGKPDAETAKLIMREENSDLLRTLLKGS